MPGAATLTPTPPPTAIPPTPIPPTPIPGADLKVKLNGGSDSNQSSAILLDVQNTSTTTAISNISVRIYFTTDGTNSGTNYVLDQYYDESGVAVITGPTLASGTTYYFNISYGTKPLPAGGGWDFQGAMHLSNWASTYSSTNDWWRNSPATLPVTFTDWPRIPAYVNGSLVWGSQP